MDLTLLDLVPSMVTEEDNVQLNKPPTLEEVIRVVFELNRDSACGLLAFFNGLTLPKAITHTNLVLIPKEKRWFHFLI